MNKPILILQMQRMGDLILSFPLMLWLERTYPGRPVWVVAEPMFYRELVRVSPAAFYLPWTETGRLAGESFHLILNLSHRPEAAALAGSLKADEIFGPIAGADGATRIRGRWQLYRASLVSNNRYNHFHWADLNALDAIPLARMAETVWPPPQRMGRELLKVGLFLGASQEDKRPDAAFWAALTRELTRRGLTVVLLGGPAEKELGGEVERLSGKVAVNSCGRLGLAELALFGQNLALCVTPDTGPMHLFSWTGRGALNLSMGPVNPWETGPYQPGRHVLRARMSCRGCWSCTRARTFCKDRFDPARVGYLAWRLARGEEARLRNASTPGLDLLVTGRNARGLFDLRSAYQNDSELVSARRLTGEFWAEAFGNLLGLHEDAGARLAWQRLVREYPTFSLAFSRSALKLGREIKNAVRGRSLLPDEGFWARFAPHLRPLTGYLHMYLQNDDFRPAAWREGLALLERLLALTGD